MKLIDFETPEMGKCGIPEETASKFLKQTFSGFKTPNGAFDNFIQLAKESSDPDVKEILHSIAFLAKEIHV